MKPAVGQVKWLVAALAIRRSHCQRYARPLHPTTQTWSDRELRPHQAKLAALLDLVTIDGEGRPTKRRADVRDLSSTVMDELKPFVDRRLLSTEAEGERTSVGVAHEAFLVNWRPLKEQIDAQQNALRARRVVENEAADWVQGGRVPGLLLQGGKLTKAVVDIGAQLKPPGQRRTPNLRAEAAFDGASTGIKPASAGHPRRTQ